MLKQLREERHLTQTELARRAKVTTGFISLMESGQRDPSLTVLRRLAKALGVTVAELVE
jgi:transcriptional regulator with XRE-family HTH domain